MSRERFLLIALLLVYLAVGSLFAVLTPDWQTPDEPAHYNYVRQIVERRRCCPQIEPGDWDQAYLDEIKAARFAPDRLAALETIQYEDHQPPLYYQFASLVYGLTHGSLIAMRLFSVLLGAGVVWCAWAVAKAVLPDRAGVALGTAAFVAFLPQHMMMLASVNNDPLNELLIGLVLVITVRFLLGQTDANYQLGQVLLVITLLMLVVLLTVHLIPASVGAVFLALVAAAVLTPMLRETGDWQIWLLGLLVGAIFTTKATGYFMAALVPLAIVLRYRLPVNGPRIIRRAYLRTLGRRLIYFLVPALLLGGFWWLRNIAIYGFPDFLGLGAHDLVVVGQPRTAEAIAQMGFGLYFSQAVRTTYHSFWGQFGWMALPLQGWMYTLLTVLPLAAVAGLVIDRFVIERPEQTPEQIRRSRAVWLVLWLMIGLTALMYIYYNITFLQLQGRYLFTALIPIGLLMALGIDAWRRWLLAKWAWAQWLPLIVFGVLALFDVYLILRVIRPNLLP